METVLEIHQRLQGDWTAGDAMALLSASTLDRILSQWESLEPLFRSRLLLSPLFLRHKALEELRPVLQNLAETACKSTDEWVRITGRSVGKYDGALHMRPVEADCPALTAVLQVVRRLLLTANPLVYRPLEESYYNLNLREELAPGSTAFLRVSKSSDFTVRDPPKEVVVEGASTTSALVHCKAPALGNPMLADLPKTGKSALLEHSNLFVRSLKPTLPPKGAATKLVKPKKAALLDLNEVSRLNKERQAEIERQQGLEKMAKDEEERKKIEVKEREKAEKEKLKADLEAGKERQKLEREAEKGKLKADLEAEKARRAEAAKEKAHSKEAAAAARAEARAIKEQLKRQRALSKEGKQGKRAKHADGPPTLGDILGDAALAAAAAAAGLDELEDIIL